MFQFAMRHFGIYTNCMDAISSSLKTLRVSYGLTAKEASEAVSMPLRTYLRYEKDEGYGNALKRASITSSLERNFRIDETKGILTLESIKSLVGETMEPYGSSIDFCYLFGSYAKGYQSEASDVDLCVSTTLTGLEYVKLLEELKLALHKRVDLLRLSEVKEDEGLLREIMKDGVKIYG